MSANVPWVSSCAGAASDLFHPQQMEWRLQIAKRQLQFLLKKADELQDKLVKCGGQSPVDGEDLAAALLKLIRTSQPFFNDLESSARSTMSQYLPMNICFQMLDFSEQLSGRFEQLLLTCASYNFLSVEESDPYSTPYFCIGSCQLGRQKITAFRYCKLVPYLAQFKTGIYKRMRWNVEDLREKPQSGELMDGDEESFIFSDYYFLCYEDISFDPAEVEGNGHAGYHGNSLGHWSIGKWVQLDPNPSTENLYDWILCEVPLATYQQLLSLGTEEPSCSGATDHLHQLLLSLQSKEMKGGTGSGCASS